MNQALIRLARCIIRNNKFIRSKLQALYTACQEEQVPAIRDEMAMGMSLSALKLDDAVVHGIYSNMLNYTDCHEDVLKQIKSFESSSWKDYLNNVLKLIPMTMQDKVVMDFGCKYGLLFPLLREAGAKKIIGVENRDWIIREGKALCKWLNIDATWIEVDEGYMPLQPETVDLIICNEVISHVPRSELPTIYGEMARILKPGGMLFISDGNNLSGSPDYYNNVLLPLYDAYELGEDGDKVGDVTIQRCFLRQRMAMIQKEYRDFTDDQLDFLASHTFGLYGNTLLKEIERFRLSGELIRRPYRKGIAPTYPDSGIVEERGFYPQQVVYELMEYGFDCIVLSDNAPGFQVVGRL